MLSKTVVLLALSASAAVASPYNHARFHRGTGMRGTDGHAHPTGGRFNESESGVAASSGGFETFTVSPVPTASSSVEPINDTPSSAAAVVSDSTTICTTYSTSTEYATSINYITVTAGPGRDVGSQSSSTVSSSTSTVSLSVSSPIAAAGAFYGSRSYGNQGQSKSSTTMATSVKTSAVSSASSSAIIASSAMTSAATTAATTAVVSKTSAATSAAATTTASSSSSSGGKKGLSYNSASLLSLFSGAGTSWSYNWGLTAGGSIPSGIEYVPMCWGSSTAASCGSTIASSGATHMLSFNEPDNSGQANMPDAAAAAQLHIKDVATPLAGKVKIGSPAVTNSGASGQGLSWLSSFLAACNPGKTAATDSCKLDFLAVHWYSDAAYYSTFETHVNGAIALATEYGITGGVWVTEFAATGSQSDQVSFLSKAIPFLDSTAGVSRYAYFMVDADGAFGMTSGNALNVVGSAYAA